MVASTSDVPSINRRRRLVSTTGANSSSVATRVVAYFFPQTLRVDFVDQQVPEESQQITEKFGQILARLRLLVNDRQRLGGRLAENRASQVRDDMFGGKTKNLEHLIFADRIAAKSD